MKRSSSIQGPLTRELAAGESQRGNDVNSPLSRKCEINSNACRLIALQILRAGRNLKNVN